MSAGASPRTGTLNSRDVHHSQLTYMSSGSQVISSSPPPAPLTLSSLSTSSQHQRYQPQHAAVRPVCSPPPRDQSLRQSTSTSPRQLSPRQLSPQQPSPMSLSLMSAVPTHRTVSPTAGDTLLHFIAHTLSHLPTSVADKNVFQQPVSQNMLSGCMLGLWVWLISIMLAVIGRPWKNVGLQFGKMFRQHLSAIFFMSATNVTDVFMVSATNLNNICRQMWTASYMWPFYCGITNE